MKKYIKFVLSSAMVLSLTFGTVAQASTLTSAQITDILNLLSAFGASTSVVANVQTALNGQPTTAPVATSGNNNCSSIPSGLAVGSRGSSVSTLQQILITAGDLNVSAPTGYFGQLTNSALQAYETANNCGGTITTAPVPVSNPIIPTQAPIQTNNQSAPIITNVSTPGLVGYSVVITGSNFTNSSTIQILQSNGQVVSSINSNNIQADIPNSGKGSSSVGNPTLSFSLPNIPNGNYYVEVLNGNVASNQESLTVSEPTAPIITNVSTPGLVGYSVVITGSNFTNSSTIQILQSNGQVVSSINSNNIQADIPNSGKGSSSVGNPTLSFSLPNIPNGNYYVEVLNGNVASNQESLTVSEPTAPIITNVSTPGLVGYSVVITGSNFTNSSTIQILQSNGQVVSSINSNNIQADIPNSGKGSSSVGNPTLSFSLPNIPNGNYYVEVLNGNVASNQESLTVSEPTAPINKTGVVYQVISINPTTATVGSTVTISGSGFDQYATVDLTVPSVPTVDMITPTSLTPTSLTFVVPTNAAGNDNIEIVPSNAGMSAGDNSVSGNISLTVTQ